jgi:uncharacterized DUF497 family protein
VFEWDRNKAQKNEMEHGVTFRDGATAFMDSSAIQFSHDEHSEEELRDFLIGRAADGRLLRVNFTERPPNLRIISARVANDFDETQYANGY